MPPNIDSADRTGKQRKITKLSMWRDASMMERKEEKKIKTINACFLFQVSNTQRLLYSSIRAGQVDNHEP